MDCKSCGGYIGDGIPCLSCSSVSFEEYLKANKVVFLEDDFDFEDDFDENDPEYLWAEYLEELKFGLPPGTILDPFKDLFPEPSMPWQSEASIKNSIYRRFKPGLAVLGRRLLRNCIDNMGFYKV